jgi:hypothetical protein
MSRIGFFTASAAALIGALVFFSGSAAGDHIAGQVPYLTCKGSVARVTLLNQSLVPTIEPLAANASTEECAEDTAGLPSVALPPSPDPAPVLTATAVQARTEILCADDDPDPAVDPADNEACDAGRRSFEQQVLSTANAADLHIVIGSGESAIDITAQAANSSARASCGPGNVPVLNSTSNVVNLVVRIAGTVIPITLPPPNQEQVVNLGIAKLILNERVGAEGARPNSPSGALTRRAIHLQVPGDPSAPATSPAAGSVADVVAAESTAGFHGGACQTSSAGICPSGSTPNAQGQCIISGTSCPPGAGRNAQGQCVITSVSCPDGTAFDPTALACVERPLGGTLVPINQQVRGFFRGSPCIGRGFGRLVAVIGTNGPDRITGTNRSDRIFALAGNDRVSGGRGDDCVEGGRGRDVLDGSNGNDTLLGGTGADQMSGGPANDIMRGGAGKDRLNGGYGNDTLVGGAGNDGISTGNGRDRVFGGAGNDIINAAIRGPAAFVDCGRGSDRVRINRNELRRTRNCEFVDITRRIRSERR